MVRMRDGVALATDVYLPEGTDHDCGPAVLIRTPYGKERQKSELIAMFTDSSDYVLVIQDTRGQHSSEGIDSVFLDDAWGEKQDGYDAVEWAAAQPWCNGKVGTWGGSAMGINQYMTAGASPPHLVCQVVIVAVPSLYHYVVFPGGVFRKYDVEKWLFKQNTSYMLDLFEAHPRYDKDWARVNLAERWDCVDVPIYHIAGWHDIFLEGNLDAFTNIQLNGTENARENQKLMVGPWTHESIGKRECGELRFPENAEADIATESIRWFDYWLKGIDNGIMEEPCVKYYQMGDPDNAITTNQNTWVKTETWPVSGDTLQLYLHEDGSLKPEPPVEDKGFRRYRFNPHRRFLRILWRRGRRHSLPTSGGRNLLLPRGPRDQREVERMRGILAYTTDVLTEPIVVCGKISANLYVSSNRKDTDFSVRITDVYPDGRSMLVGDGIVKARFHSSPDFTIENFLVPDSVYLLSVDLWSTAITFAPGHRIRVSVSSANYQKFEMNPNTGAKFKIDDRDVKVARNRIYSDLEYSSCIVLPVQSLGDSLKRTTLQLTN